VFCSDDNFSLGQQIAISDSPDEFARNTGEETIPVAHAVDWRLAKLFQAEMADGFDALRVDFFRLNFAWLSELLQNFG
jgi:hypothetical protein